jgi:hypothetical protein
MKKVLTIHYSQTGQLTEIIRNVTKDFSSADFEIEHVVCNPTPGFDFPWSKSNFFDAMPECVLNVGCEIEDFKVNHEKYDLVIFGYQPWFLSPSIPSMGILKNKQFQEIIKNTPVITVIGGRNMWINSQKDVKAKLIEAEAVLVGNIPFVDKNMNLLSAVTIMHWMFGGKKNKKWNLFPLPGVSQKDIDGANLYTDAIQNYLTNDNNTPLQEMILAKNEIDVKWSIMFIEARAKKLFSFWANLIVRKGTTSSKRKKWLLLYRFYLIFALFIVSPIVLTIYALLFRPFFLKKERLMKKAILSV